jgi:hypothetical protein
MSHTSIRDGWSEVQMFQALQTGEVNQFDIPNSRRVQIHGPDSIENFHGRDSLLTDARTQPLRSRNLRTHSTAQALDHPHDLLLAVEWQPDRHCSIANEKCNCTQQQPPPRRLADR